MKKLILIGGELASGKSTLSSIISEKYNVMCINKDRIKEILGDRIETKNREENIKLSKLTFDLEKYILIKVNENLIIESNFKQEEIDSISEIVKVQNIDVLSLKLYGEYNILYQRYMKRLDENRHPIHKSIDFSNIDNFINCQNSLRRVNYIGTIINIDATSFSYQDDEKLFKEIEEFLKE